MQKVHLNKGKSCTENLVGGGGGTQCSFMTRQVSTYSLTVSRHGVWPIIHVAHNLYSTRIIPNLFGNWLFGVHKNTRSFILVAATALVWALWLYKNDVVLTNKIYFLHCHSHLFVYTLAPYLACTTVFGAHGALYDGMY